MLLRTQLPTVSPKPDAVPISAALGVLGAWLGIGQTNKNMDPCVPIEAPDEHPEVETIKIPRRSYVQHRVCNSIRSQYRRTHELDGGSSGHAYLCVHETSKLMRCVKKSSGLESSDAYAQLSNEIKILKTLDHASILKIFESVVAGGHLYMATEYCEGGKLEDEMIRKFNKYGLVAEDYIARIMKQIVQAVVYLHRRNILHKDLKLNNILLDKTKKHAKLIDFGLSEQLDGSNGTSEIAAGTPEFLPPEAFSVQKRLFSRAELRIKAGLSLKADIWALGMMLYSLAYGLTLSGYNIHVASTGGHNQPKLPVSKRYNSYSEELRDLVGKMLKHDPNERPSAEECLQHPFFKDVPDEEIDVVEEQTILDTLKTFSDKSQLYAALSNVVQHELNIDSCDPVVILFKKIDTNGDGELSMEELYNYLNAHGWNTDDVDRLLRVADVDGNGYLEISEFVTACRVWHIDKDEYLLQAAFCNLDIDDEGSIGIEELTSISNLGQGMGQPLEEMGCGSYGRVNEQDFVHYMVENNKDGSNDSLAASISIPNPPAMPITPNDLVLARKMLTNATTSRDKVEEARQVQKSLSRNH